MTGPSVGRGSNHSEAIAILAAEAQTRRRRSPHAIATGSVAAGARRIAASRRRRGGGFTYTELLVSIGIIALLTAIAVPLVGRSRASAQSVSCLSQLRQIGGAFFQYAADNDKRLPDPFEAQLSWEELLSKYLPDRAHFHCPADNELFPAVGSSYDWRDTGRPETTLAGRPITDTTRADPVLAFEALPGWHVKGRINAVTLSGAASSMDQEVCLEDLQLPIRPAPPRAAGQPGGGGGGGAGAGRNRGSR